MQLQWNEWKRNMPGTLIKRELAKLPEKRVVYGHNALEILKKLKRSRYTALANVGKV